MSGAEPISVMTEAALIEALKDPMWRLRNLYKIMDKNGDEVLFAPNPTQVRFIEDLWFRNIVLKARQLGYSTLIQLMMLDACLFVPNTQAAVIAQDEGAAETIFRSKVKFAYDHLPEAVRAMLPTAKDRADELMLSNGSSLRVAISARSGTLQWLHVSEFGKICAKRPESAKEIVTGSLPSVDRNGIIVIESTAEGQEGYFHDMCKIAEADQQSGRELDNLEYRFHFASWWEAAEYQADADKAVIAANDNRYFERIEHETGRPLSERQKAWYVLTRRSVFAGDDAKMRQEYPSTSKEAFEGSTEGIIFADQLMQARLTNRIGDFPYDPRLPVNTFWDLGLRHLLVIWFHQQQGRWNDWIDYIELQGEPYSEAVRQMQERGYVWGRHFLPHDGDQRRPGAEAILTPAQMLEGLGLRNIEIVPRIDFVPNGNQQVRDLFPLYRFDQTKCAQGIKRLSNYKKTLVVRTQTYSEIPFPDMNSDAADALRQHAQAANANLITGKAVTPLTPGDRNPSNYSTRPRRKNRSGMAA